MASKLATSSKFSLDDWNDLAPLSPAESASVQRVAQHATVKKLPHHLATATPPSASLFPTTRSRLDLASLNPAESTTNTHLTSTGSALLPPADPLALRDPITSTQQFHDWFSRVEASLEAAHESAYRSHLSTLNDHLSTCTDLTGAVDDSLALLSELSANLSYVQENSSSLQTACEILLEEQQHLTEVAQALSERLEYFRELERSVRLLNAPGEMVVERPEFLEGLDRVGVCLEYLRANTDFLDAPIYLLRFQQCLTRSMTLIKMYFVSAVKRVREDVVAKMATAGGGKDLSETALQALLFTKFAQLAPSLRILIRELEARSTPPASSFAANPHSAHSSSSLRPSSASPNPPPPALIPDEDYAPLLLDCHTTFFSTRSLLLDPFVAEEVRRMDPSKSDLVHLCKTGCGYLRSVAMAEWDLSGLFWASKAGIQETYKFLSGLCDHLYDVLRPRVLHEPSLQVLVDLCGVVDGMMALDTSTAAAAAGGGGGGGVGGRLNGDEEDDDLDDENSLLSPNLSGLGRLRFAVLLDPILQDVQTRLVFRAQAVIQSEVLHFVPSKEELDYPARLLRRSGGKGEGKGEGELEDEEGWYASLRRTRWVLERLRGCVNNAIFTDFASEAFTLCRQSLQAAALQISSSPSSATPTGTVGEGEGESAAVEDKKADGQLFLIRHLLILKELVVTIGEGVELVRRERGVEFGSVTEALSALLRTTSSALFNPRSLLTTLPHFVAGAGEERMVDAKMDLDSALKTSCETFITTSSLSLTPTLRAFLDRCTSFLSSPSPGTSTSSPPALSDQPWATPEEVLSLHSQFQTRIQEEVNKLVRKMRVYLREEKTVRVLVPPLLGEVGEVYATFYNLIRSEYGFTISTSLIAPAEMAEKLKAASRV
ncbi:hypothetical protein JCM11641_006272 [Rhodosporidiobolus odoratus]